MIWHGIKHDMSKFTPVEWNGYVYNFFEKDGSTKKGIHRPGGGYDPLDQSLEFQYSVLHHHQSNGHHQQHWVIVGDDGKVSPVEIPDIYLWEMVADWYGAGKARRVLHKQSIGEWYHKNSGKMTLHPKSRAKLETFIESFWNTYLKLTAKK